MTESGETTVGGEIFLHAAREHLAQLLRKHDLVDEDLLIRVGLLSPEEAIGAPLRRDFPILLGRERVVEARFKGARGHAYTDSPAEFHGPVREILERPLDSNADRALLVATLNAVLRHLGQVTHTVHCRDEEPEKCAVEIARTLRERVGEGTVGLIGCNPAILEALVGEFGVDRLRLTDLNPDNIGSLKFGVETWDGLSRMDDLVRESDLVIVTGTTIVNNSFPAIREAIERRGRDFLLYGVTAAGFCHLFGLERICPYAHEG